MTSIVKQFSISGLLLLESALFSDDRGFFMEAYKESDFFALGLPKFVQDNFSFSLKGVIRALHYQLPPKDQGKLIRVLEGRIWDVALDIRPGSKTYGQFEAVELSADSGQAFYIPSGFAHGFLVLSDTARVLYKTTKEYEPKAERGIIWNDPDLKIPWPAAKPLVSERDLSFPFFKDAAKFSPV